MHLSLPKVEMSDLIFTTVLAALLVSSCALWERQHASWLNPKPAQESHSAAFASWDRYCASSGLSN